MIYTYIDGDNIGLKIEQSFMENDEKSLIEVNNKVIEIVKQITNYLIEHEQQIIFSGADGIICKGLNLNISLLLNNIRKMDYSITFSIGSGKNLKDCYIALRYAKSLNKNIAVKLINQTFQIIN